MFLYSDRNSQKVSLVVGISAESAFFKSYWLSKTVDGYSYIAYIIAERLATPLM
jgi:hypothetical protein